MWRLYIAVALCALAVALAVRMVSDYAARRPPSRELTEARPMQRISLVLLCAVIVYASVWGAG